MLVFIPQPPVSTLLGVVCLSGDAKDHTTRIMNRQCKERILCYMFLLQNIIIRREQYNLRMTGTTHISHTFYT